MTRPIAGLHLAFAFAQAQPQLAPARISGRVTVEGSNQPIAGARVVLFPSRPRMGAFTPPGEAITDQDGRFAFDRVAGGSYNLDVQKTGFVSFPGTPGRPYTVQVEAGQSVENINVRLQKGGTIVGRLLDATGQPLTDASVIALRQIPLGGSLDRYVPTPGAGQPTNDIGEFRIPGLAPGDYIVAASPRGQFPFGGLGGSPAAAVPSPSRTTPITTYYPGTSDRATAQTIRVAAEQTVENIVFTMLSAPAFRISGVVVDENGNAVGGAMVMLMNDPRSRTLMGPSGSARTQVDGRFVITSVPAGTYRLTASVPVTVTGGTVPSGGSGGVSTWSSSGGGGSVTTWSTSSGGASAGGTSIGIGPGATPTPTEVSVAAADVTGLRIVVRR
jgi:hypothetical protein